MYDETDFIDLNDFPDDRRTTKQKLSEVTKRALDYWYQGGSFSEEDDDDKKNKKKLDFFTDID